MRTFLWVVLVLDQLFVLIVGALRLERYELSEFVLREQFGGRSDVYSKLRRSLNKRLPQVRRFQQVKLAVAFALGAALFTHLNTPPALGFLYLLISLLAIAILQRLKTVQDLSAKLFEAMLNWAIKLTDLLGPLWWLIGSAPGHGAALPASQAELIDMLNKLPDTVVAPTERQRLTQVLQMKDRTVKDIMTPKKKVLSVSPHTTLGPVVLSDLEKSGHGYFPVVTSSGEVEGILRLSDLANLHTAKQHSTVKELMSMQVTWVNVESTLPELLQAFLKEKQYLVFVQNMENEFAGIVTFSDVLTHALAVGKD